MRHVCFLSVRVWMCVRCVRVYVRPGVGPMVQRREGIHSLFLAYKETKWWIDYGAAIKLTNFLAYIENINDGLTTTEIGINHCS